MFLRSPEGGSYNFDTIRLLYANSAQLDRVLAAVHALAFGREMRIKCSCERSSVLNLEHVEYRVRVIINLALKK